MPLGEVWDAVGLIAGCLAAVGYASDTSFLPITGWRWLPLWLLGMAVPVSTAVTQPAGWRLYAGIGACVCLSVGLVRRLAVLQRHDGSVRRSSGDAPV